MADESLSFLARLKQHHIYRVVVAYAVGAWVVMQVATRVFPYFGWSGAVPIVITILILGFPVVLVLAWIFIKPKDPAKIGWQQRHWKLSASVAGAVVILVVISGFFAWRFSAHRAQLLAATTKSNTLPVAESFAAPSAATTIPAKSIAVLPFENLSRDPDNAYFADGMQDMILTKLADIGDLKVIARTSTEKYGSHPTDLKAIAQQLGVATILEGSVQKSGNQVLINVQLIDANTDAHLWADDYQRSLDNVFGVEGEVAKKVAETLQVKLADTAQQAVAVTPTSNPAAYDLFLRAEYLSNKAVSDFTSAGLDTAIGLYEQALAQDPKFALAYARLSFAQSYLIWRGGSKQISMQQLGDASQKNAEQALTLQPALADAHAAMGYYYYWVHLNYATALQSFDAALKARPNDADILAATGYVLRREGKWDQAIQQMSRAMTLNPRATDIAAELAYTYWMVRSYALAEQTFQRALALDPDDTFAAGRYARFILARDGDVTRAMVLLQGNDPRLQVEKADFLDFQRKYQDAISVIADIPDLPSTFGAGGKALVLGNLYHDAGDTAQARPLLLEARRQLRVAIRTQPAEGFAGLTLYWLRLGYADVMLGDQDAGLAAVHKALELTPLSRDHFGGIQTMGFAAAIYAQAGRADLALPLIEQLLNLPGAGEELSPALLRLDPVWDPIRNDPRFQALLKKYGASQPAAATSSGAASRI